MYAEEFREAAEEAARELVSRRNYQWLHLGINAEFPENYWLYHTIDEMKLKATERRPLE